MNKQEDKEMQVLEHHQRATRAGILGHFDDSLESSFQMRADQQGFL